MEAAPKTLPEMALLLMTIMACQQQHSVHLHDLSMAKLALSSGPVVRVNETAFSDAI